LFFGEGPTANRWGRFFYDRHYAWPVGVKLYYHSDGDKAGLTGDRVCIDVSGSALDMLGTYQQAVFARGLLQFDFKASRGDGYFDDYSRRITPTELYRAVHGEDADGNITKRDYTGFRSVHYDHRTGRDGVTGDMVCFGRRGREGSGKYLRVYDKALESNGEIDAIRWENEYSGDRAIAFFNLVADTGNDPARLGSAITGSIAGSIDFLKRSERPHEKNLSRLERYDWWQSILDDLGDTVTLKAPTPDKSIEKAVLYVEKQVTPNLQMLRKAFGDRRFYQWLLDVVAGEDRITAKHQQCIDLYTESRKEGLPVDILDLRRHFANHDLTLEGFDDEVSELQERGGPDGTGSARMF
jgi:hypothetical protein